MLSSWAESLFPYEITGAVPGSQHKALGGHFPAGHQGCTPDELREGPEALVDSGSRRRQDAEQWEAEQGRVGLGEQVSGKRVTPLLRPGRAVRGQGGQVRISRGACLLMGQ